MPFVIREWSPGRERATLRPLVVVLQDFERGLEPTLPGGEAMADAYLTFLVERCARFAGRMFVAEEAGGAAGFVCVLTRVPPDGPDDAIEEYAYVSDLVVCPEHRGQGLGRRLLARAEAAARESGARSLQIGVLARNRVAHELYRRMGFGDFQVRLVKRF
jgi:GNAT superfamily N-acetyltransferase